MGEADGERVELGPHSSSGGPATQPEKLAASPFRSPEKLAACLFRSPTGSKWGTRENIRASAKGASVGRLYREVSFNDQVQRPAQRLV